MSMPLSQMWYVYRYSHTAPKICKSPFSPNVQGTDTESELFVSVKDPFDYQGRSFLHPPQDVGVNLRSEEPPEKCFLPKKQIFTWTGHTKGVSAIRWFPRYAHLLLSCSMDTKIKVSGFFFFFPFLLLPFLFSSSSSSSSSSASSSSSFLPSFLPFLLLPHFFIFCLPFFFFLCIFFFSSSSSFTSYSLPFSASFSTSSLLFLLPSFFFFLFIIFFSSSSSSFFFFLFSFCVLLKICAQYFVKLD